MNRFKDALLVGAIVWVIFTYGTEERIVISEVEGVVMAKVYRAWVWR
jgi:hypothetical protein